MDHTINADNIIQFNQLTTSLKSMESINSDQRYFEGLLTVQMKDKQGEVTIVDELYKVLPIWMDRGAPISDTHSNRIIGKGINYSKTVVKNEHGEDLPAIKITGKIFKNYELDNIIWGKIKNNEYKGLSFGGATRSNRTPMKMKDGSMAYALSNLEHYEVAVCKDPAVPMAIITDYNPVAKANFSSTMRDEDKMVIHCTKMGCFVEKSYVDKDSLIKIEDEDDKNTKVEVLDEWKNDDNDSGEDDDKKKAGEIEQISPYDWKKVREAQEKHRKKSGYQTEAGNDQLGGQGKTEDKKDERKEEDEENDNDEVKRRDHSDSNGDITSAYNQNVGRHASSGRKIKADTTATQGGGGVRENSSGTYVQGSGDSNDINIVTKPERNEEKGAPNIKVVKVSTYKEGRTGDMNAEGYEGGYNEGSDDVRTNIRYGAPKLTTDLAHKVLGAKKTKIVKSKPVNNRVLDNGKLRSGDDFANPDTSLLLPWKDEGKTKKLKQIKNSLKTHSQIQVLKKINDSLGHAHGCKNDI